MANPSAAWSTADTTRSELVLTFLNAGRLGFDLTLSGVSCIAEDATAAVSSMLRVGMTLRAVQGRSVLQLSAEETRALWKSTFECRPLALTFAMDAPSSNPVADAGAALENSASQEHYTVPTLESAEEQTNCPGHSRAEQHLRSPTVATQRMVLETVDSLVGLSKTLKMQQEQQGYDNGTGGQVRLDSSAIATVNASAEALRAAADEIELLQRELRMFQHHHRNQDSER
eukprot:COSAG02_NODE_628_length_19343_cov_15.829297_14_plen_229_part_00